jgi:hypothetical protein
MGSLGASSSPGGSAELFASVIERGLVGDEPLANRAPAPDRVAKRAFMRGTFRAPVDQLLRIGQRGLA